MTPAPDAPAAAFRFASPERRWRAACLVLLAAWLGWRGFHYAGPDPYVGQAAGGVLAGALAALAVPVARTCLIVGDIGVTDRRALRTVVVPWREITELRVGRPGGLWGGFCLIAERDDGTSADLLSTRVYSRAPSSRHLDELERFCWMLQEILAAHTASPPSDPAA